MTTNTYPFARFFIRIAIGLAIFVVLLGFVFIAYFYSSMTNELESVRYQPSAALSLDATQLANSYIGTQKRLLHSLNTKTFPDAVPVVNISEEIAKAANLSPASQPSAYLKIGNDTAASIIAIKKSHFDEFSIAIDQLRQTLLSKAAELRQRYAQQKSSQPTSAPTPSPTPSTNTASVSPLFRLFSDETGNDEGRLNAINSAKQYLNDLRAKSQKQESLDQINQASIYLARAESLLDYMKKVEENISNQPEHSLTQEGQEQEQMISMAEQAAAQLDQYKSELNQSLYERWVVDADDQRLISDATEALNLASASQTRASGIRMNTLRSMGEALLSCLALAFLIMVIADFLRAFLNMSNNTDTLANAQVVERIRNAAAQIVEQAPGIWLSVLGGESDIAREIFLANLPNIRVAHHDGAIAVSLPALEAQTFLHDQFCALLHAGVSEADAIKEIHALSLNCGMAADAWR